MNILIVYASKSGTTESCARMLSNELDNVDLVNLEHTTPLISDYGTVIIGGSIRFGRVHPLVKTFMDQNLEELKQKRIGLFICCGFVQDTEQHFLNNFPYSLLEQAVAIDSFGGEIRPEALGNFERFMAKLITKTTALKEDPPKILPANIHKFAEKIEESIRGYK